MYSRFLAILHVQQANEKTCTTTYDFTTGRLAATLRPFLNHSYKIMGDFLAFNSNRNQFQWTGSVKQFESFIIQRLNVSKEDVWSKANNGICMVWKTPNATFNFYLKTKTLQVQDIKPLTGSIREILFQSLGHSHRLPMKLSPAMKLTTYLSN